MNTIIKIAGFAAIVGMIVYGVVGYYNYRYLIAHQPPHQSGIPMPADVTAFPPSSAWVYAIYYALLAIFCTFITLYVLLRIRKTRLSQPLPQKKTIAF